MQDLTKGDLIIYEDENDKNEFEKFRIKQDKKTLKLA